jgi:hypothetical protein
VLPVCHRRTCRGLSLLELLIAIALLTAGLLTHVSVAVSERHLSRHQVLESEALSLARQMVERLRADPNWTALYDWLRGLRVAAEDPIPPGERFDDGLLAYSPQTYYSDFDASARLPSFRVLVEVPTPVAPPGQPTQPPALRENVTEPAFGLPADLNGDGKINPSPRDGDYAALPVVVRCRWEADDGASRETSLTTWLRGP